MLTIHRQRGAVLLLVLLVVIIGMGAVLLSIYSKSALQVEKDQKTARVLAEAKAALLSYAATYASDNPGEYGILPCPDSNTSLSDGIQDGNCKARGVNAVGRLPWRSLELPPLRDGAGECLWYAVSGDYKQNPKADMLNEDTNGLFSIYDSAGNLVSGSNPEDRVVAIIIAPGNKLGSQDRTDESSGTEICGGNYTASNYLEGNDTYDNSSLSGTADTVDSFINASASSKNDSTPFNDQIITITREEIWEIIRNQTDFDTAMSSLTQQAAQCMADFGNLSPTPCGGAWTCNPPYRLRLPWPADIDLGAAGTDYRDILNYSDTFFPPVSLFGRLPNEIDDSVTNTGKTSAITTTECMQSVSAEMDKLYQNWKDHLFYVVGWGYEPFYATEPTCYSTSNRRCPIINNDLSSFDKLYPGIVIFSHDRESGITRNAPPPTGDSDDKQTVSNYLEGNNASNYPDYNGYFSYQTDGGVNDLLFCIKRDATSLSVAQCP